MQVGIVSYGLYLPEKYQSAKEVAKYSNLSLKEVKSLGIERKLIPDKHDQPVFMAVQAAKNAFNKTNEIIPEDVDLVIWTGEEYKDYIAQTASIRLQEEVGCKNAWAFDLVGQNITLVQGIKIAHDIMIGDKEIDTVLLAGGSRNIDLVNYINADTKFLLPLSASGGAILLKKNYSKNNILSVDFKIDEYMADEVYVPGGGTEIPFNKENLNSSIMFYNVQNPKKMENYLKRIWIKSFIETAKKTLKEFKPDYVCLRHLPPLYRNKILTMLDIDKSRSADLSEWGCLGSNDVLLSLELGILKKKIQKDSLILFLTGGIGFMFAAALIKWNKGERDA
jgi:3-oxoacyl-[acyl-carrier-protein] synthase-3